MQPIFPNIDAKCIVASVHFIAVISVSSDHAIKWTETHIVVTACVPKIRRERAPRTTGKGKSSSPAIVHLQYNKYQKHSSVCSASHHADVHIHGRFGARDRSRWLNGNGNKLRFKRMIHANENATDEMKAAQTSKLQKVIDHCESTEHCQRSMQLRHFGGENAKCPEESPTSCDNCVRSAEIAGKIQFVELEFNGRRK